jgi:hypothetical protein
MLTFQPALTAQAIGLPSRLLDAGGARTHWLTGRDIGEEAATPERHQIPRNALNAAKKADIVSEDVLLGDHGER